MATKKTTKPKASAYTKQIATRMDVVSFARLLATSLGNDRWFTEDVIKSTFKQSGPAGTVKKDTSKATKIPNLESDNKVMDSLLSIHDLLKKNYDNKLKSDEKKNQFKVEQSVERKKQNDDFIKALGGIGGTTNVTNNATATKVDDGMGIDDLLGPLSALKDLAKILFQVGRFFLFNPVGIAILGATSLFALLAMDKNPEQTTKSILAAGDAGEANKQMMDVVENEGGAVKRKQNLLANRPMSKKSFNVFTNKDVELQEKYLKEIGFDEKTGLTQAEKNEGYTGVDDDGNPIKSKPKASPANATTSEPTAEPAAAAPASPTSSPATSAPAEASLSKDESIVSPPAAAAAPMSSPNVSQQLDVVNNENLEMKLPQEPSDKGMMITNNEKTQGQKGSTKVALPSVRNAEETFQRMILNSTRVV